MNIPMLMVRMDESNSPLAFVVRLRYQDSQRITLQTSEPNTCRNMLKWFAKWLAHQQTCSCNGQLKNFLPLSPISIVYQHQMIRYKELWNQMYHKNGMYEQLQSLCQFNHEYPLYRWPANRSSSHHVHCQTESAASSVDENTWKYIHSSQCASRIQANFRWKTTSA